ncbi:Methyltransferase domain-containing protein [Oceanospirillum multiglobuliferum]|uniref:Methyltransferase n=1 Tax=Oceanospirillum multiglobuliferum TaxID=64969 RepID=A0A1T4NPY2_9GAMM|nr:class I SAM-dependent methyltransferase [Oceanospirillum multiglobuliferum]OPX55727.1 hypothetical protein BTE48_07485 [Oceanospirillum multiglobuliferum]SJZ81116.1 Methyltransferase domain-containing protein [Oceanospirillum multiglobuliferum]
MSSQSLSPQCPLCQHSATTLFFKDPKRHYWQCAVCALVFVAKAEQLSHEEEKAFYGFHENDPNDQGYRRFLDRMALPMQQRVAKGAKGLDFGSGPGPTLSVMLQERGYQMKIFDPYFANQPEVLTESYDFITSTEVFEHLSAPHLIIEQLLSLLKPEGYLGVMTKRLVAPAHFSGWHYKNDPTHISFYADQSFQWMADHYGLQLELIDQDVVVLQKRAQ